MKKLLSMTLVLSTLTLAACGAAKFDTFVSKGSISIGESTFTKQQAYEFLKKTNGANVVTSWFKEAIYTTENKTAEADITERVELLWEEYSDNIYYPSSVDHELKAKGYVGTDAIANFKKYELRSTALDELFNEWYIIKGGDDDKNTVAKNYWKDYAPRHVWAINKDILSNMKGTVTDIKNATNKDLEFAKKATYWSWAEEQINNATYYDLASGKSLGNKLTTYGKKGLTRDINFFSNSLTTVQGGSAYTADKYLKTGSLGAILNNSSVLPASINKHLFNDELTTAESGKAPVGEGKYHDAWIDETTNFLFSKATGTSANANGTIDAANVKEFFTEGDDSHYLVKAKIININASTDEEKAMKADAIRQIAKVSAVKTRAQNQLFKGWNLEAWDQDIWDAIESTILNNKD